MRIIFISITMIFLSISLSYEHRVFAENNKNLELNYASKEVILSGIMKRHTFPGPPNYSSIREGDLAEQYWILHLSQPVDVYSVDKEEIINETEKNILFIQLVLEKTEYEKYKRLLDKKVHVIGNLFHGHTGHHHKKVLMDVAEIKLIQ